MKIKDIDTALIQFENAAIKHAKSTECGDFSVANKCYKLISQSISFLKENNGTHELRDFLCSDSVGVRLWAATYLLPLMENEAINVLEEISLRDDIHSHTASVTINEWKCGNLKI